MQCHISGFKKFISSPDLMFSIPVYQRNYDWRTDDCWKLIDDIKKIAKNEETHFFGSICFQQKNRDEAVIIDGQQRLTTIMLLLKAICTTTSDEALKKRIEDRYLFNQYKDGQVKEKLKPVTRDKSVFQKIMTRSYIDHDEFSELERRSNIFLNYIFLENAVSELNKAGISESDIEDAIERFSIIEIELDTEEPQKIFESLNSTGRSLTAVDNIRNYLFMSSPYNVSERLYHDYWLKIEEILDENISKFMTHFIIIRMAHMNNDIRKQRHPKSCETYDFFKECFSDLTSESAEECLSSMLEYAKYYSEFVNLTHTDSDINKRYWQLSYILEQEENAAIYMFLNKQRNSEKLSKEDYVKILDTMISSAFRNKVCKRRGQNKNKTKILIENLIGLECNYDNFLDVIIKKNLEFPSDREFRECLEESSLYSKLGSKRCRYFFYMIDKSRGNKELPDFEDTSVEHICPQNMSDEWIKYLKERGGEESVVPLIHSIGNLAVTNYNSEMSNQEYIIKKAFYNKSSMWTTREVASISEWNAASIKRRAQSLVDEAVKVWKKLPCGEKQEDLYNLCFSPDIFSGTRPTKVVMFGETKELSSWRQMLLYVVRTLYKIDPETFIEMYGMKGSLCHTVEIVSTSQKNKYYYPIDDNNFAYVYVPKRVDVIYSIMRDIVNEFDEFIRLNVKEELSFAIH